MKSSLILCFLIYGNLQGVLFLNQFFYILFYHNINQFHYENTNRAGDNSPYYINRYISISALNALPGLAVSPILGDLNKIFPSATDLEIQMLSSLPSLLIIPFILLSGKLNREGEQSVVVASRIDYFRSKRHTLPVVR